MIKKLVICLGIIIALFITINGVNADWLANGACERSTTCTISRQLVNDTSGVSISIASCNITVRSPTNITSILINNQPMANQSGGYYNYDVDFDNNGYYPSTMQCNYATNVDVADVSFSVIDREADKKLITLPILYILLIAGWGGLIFGYIRVQKGILGMQYLMLLGCILISIAGVVILRQGIDNTIDWTTNAFAILNIAVGLIFIGYFILDQFGVEL